LEREINISKSRYSLDAIENYPEASHLIESMIQHDPLSRPTIEDVLAHCLFWNDSQKLLFLKDASDRMESEKQYAPIMQDLEYNASSVVGTDWSHVIIPPPFLFFNFSILDDRFKNS
jgi:serine/threonine protein kinase